MLQRLTLLLLLLRSSVLGLTDPHTPRSRCRSWQKPGMQIRWTATAAVVVTIGDLVVLTTVVAKKEADPAKDFFPLAVFYQEKFYATGRIPGGFFKREARPTERETLTSRLIDRPIRPMFPDHFTNEIQVFCTVMSSDKKQNPDIASMIGASAALTISGVPFDGPMGAARAVSYTHLRAHET